MKRSAITTLLRLHSYTVANAVAYRVAADKRNPYGKNEPDRQDLATPRWFFDKVAAAFERYGRFTLDVCAKRNSAVVDRYFTRRQDGLKQDWARGRGELNWCNPPFSQAGRWLEKAFDEAQRGGSTVMLLPFRDPAARWFYRWAPFAQRITVLVPRLQYYCCGGESSGFNDNASFCSCLWLITPAGVKRGIRDHRRASVDWWNIGKRPEGARR
jgi:phage N-6-adenine-methyltransferase